MGCLLLLTTAPRQACAAVVANYPGLMLAAKSNLLAKLFGKGYLPQKIKTRSGWTQGQALNCPPSSLSDQACISVNSNGDIFMTAAGVTAQGKQADAASSL